nr:hypothetical protein [Tanacetum cinerariifolium]
MEGGHENVMPTQEYVRKIFEDAFEDDHFTVDPWLSAVVYMHGVIMSCTPNALGDLTVTLKDPSGEMGCTIHYRVFEKEDGYAKSINVGYVLILRNVFVFTTKQSNNYLNITIRNIVKGARPNRRLRPDAFEAKAEWWVSSRAFFDGRIREPPRIPSPVNLPSRYDVPKDIYRYFDEHDMFIKELREKNVAQDKMLNKMDNYFEGMNPCNMSGPMKAPIEVHEHYGLAVRSLTWPKSPRLIRPRLSSRCRFDYPSSYLATLHIAAPMAQQGFAPRSSTYRTGPSHNRDVGKVNPDAMHREKREIRPSKKFQSPFTTLPETTVAPKKGANNIRKMTRNANVSAFDLENTGIDLNAQVEEVMFMGSCATDEYISFHNVDPNKGRDDPSNTPIIRSSVSITNLRDPGCMDAVLVLATIYRAPGGLARIINSIHKLIC